MIYMDLMNVDIVVSLLFFFNIMVQECIVKKPDDAQYTSGYLLVKGSTTDFNCSLFLFSTPPPHHKHILQSAVFFLFLPPTLPLLSSAHAHRHTGKVTHAHTHPHILKPPEKSKEQRRWLWRADWPEGFIQRPVPADKGAGSEDNEPENGETEGGAATRIHNEPR